MDTSILKVDSTDGLKEYEGSNKFFLELVSKDPNDDARRLKIIEVIDDENIRVCAV